MALTEQGKKTLIEVAEWLEAGAPHVDINGRIIDHFDMQYGVYDSEDCGTACCISGAICQFKGLGEVEDGDLDFFGDNGAGNLAREFLGIDIKTAEKLFEPWTIDEQGEHNYSLYNNPALAAKVLWHFIDTGEVKWIEFLEETL